MNAYKFVYRGDKLIRAFQGRQDDPLLIAVLNVYCSDGYEVYDVDEEDYVALRNPDLRQTI